MTLPSFNCKASMSPPTKRCSSASVKLLPFCGVTMWAFPVVLIQLAIVFVLSLCLLFLLCFLGTGLAAEHVVARDIGILGVNQCAAESALELLRRVAD